MSQQPKTQGLWGPLSLETDQVMRASLGLLRLWIRHEETDWFYACERPEGANIQFGKDFVKDVPANLDWNRLGCEKASRGLLLQPALPDRAVVVRPDMPFTCLPGERIQFFVRIPLWIRLVAVNHGKSVWADLPTRILSKTWFGSPEEGEPGYALRTLATRSLEGVPRDPDRILCPVRLRNQSTDVLKLVRLCLRVRHLGIYEGATSLWSNEAGVSYRGDDEWSRVAFGRAAPPFDQAEQQLAEAREPTRGAFSLKSITTKDFFA